MAMREREGRGGRGGNTSICNYFTKVPSRLKISVRPGSTITKPKPEPALGPTESVTPTYSKGEKRKISRNWQMDSDSMVAPKRTPSRCS